MNLLKSFYFSEYGLEKFYNKVIWVHYNYHMIIEQT